MRQSIKNITLDQAEGDAKNLLTGAKAAIGMVPNLFGVFANSPAVLEGYLGLNKSLSKGVLTARQRDQIALTVGQINRCQYCLSAHTLMGKGAGLSAADIASSRVGQASDPVTQGILALATALVEKHGQVGEEELVAAREAGVSDAQILETVAHVALNVLTNYTNNLAGTIIDFPVVELEPALA
jgi:uncharacterized peroxidase-related enzyme